MNIGGNKSIALFVGSKENAIGGMETHAKYFYNYFKNNGQLKCIVTKGFIWDCVQDRKYIFLSYNEMINIIKNINVQVFFFNDGHWIENYFTLRKDNPYIVMIMRSGGNEFMKAPVMNMSLSIEKRRQIWANAINMLDYIISNSSYSTHRMISIGIMKDKIVMVRGGVDVKQCIIYSENKTLLHQELLDKYHIDSETCLIGIVSRFEKFKGIEQTIEALSLISNVKWHLFIAGSGPEKNNIKKKLNNCLKPSQYTMIGQLNSKQSLRLIASLDYLLNMSLEFVRESGNDTYIHTETMGRSMIEAVCCKTPIIATRVGGTSELFCEQEKIGVILENLNSFTSKIKIEAAINEKIEVSAKEINRYDWSYIFENIYLNLMNIKGKVIHKINLVIDLEGSIIHDFCDEEINRHNFEKILHLSNICNVIINTAGELDSIFEHYPYVYDYINRIIIIANCGMKVLLYGKRFLFWEKYYESLYGPDEKLVQEIKKYIENKGGYVNRISRVNKLYINFKVSGVAEDTINEINEILKDTPYVVCKNNNNIKLISEEIQKGNTLRFICHHILKTYRNIGVGNGVLDMSFLDLCQKAYFINPKEMNNDYICVSILNSLDMQEFVEVLENAIKKESSYCNS